MYMYSICTYIVRITLLTQVKKERKESLSGDRTWHPETGSPVHCQCEVGRFANDHW